MVHVVTDSLTLANELRPALLRLARLVRRESHALGVTGGQVSLLTSIEAHPGITARDLGEREQISAPGISAQLERLEAAGLIRRERASDRRRVGVSITREGARVLRSVSKKRTAWLAARLEKLLPHELAAIEAAIGPMARLLEVEA